MTPWKQDFKNGNPVWQIDLGKKHDVRNALLKVQYDSMKYSYEIWTSPDNKPLDQTSLRIKNSSQQRNPGRFFGQGCALREGRLHRCGPGWNRLGQGGFDHDFAIYKDAGVESVKEFLLKGLAVEGKDLVFNPTVATYELEQKGLDSQLTIRALPYDPQATVTINGTPVTNPINARRMKDASPVTVELQAGLNPIDIAVTSKSGAGTKHYTLNVRSDGGNSYNAVECFVPNKNGANGWRYQYQDTKTGEITDITRPMIAVGDGRFAFGSAAKPWEFAGPLAMHPGSGVNVVRTFKSPKAGRALINATARLHAGNSGNVLLRVYKNDTLIHPTQGNGTFLGDKGNQIEKIENLPVDLALDDEIRFVVDPNGSNGGDVTLWDTTISFEPLDVSGVSSFKIQGDTTLTGFSDQPLQTRLQASVRIGKKVVDGVDANWSIVQPMKGITIDRFGILSVEPGITDTSFKVRAVLKGNPKFSDEKEIAITRKLRPWNAKIPLDPAKAFGSAPYQNNEAVGFKKPSMAIPRLGSTAWPGVTQASKLENPPLSP
jgi:hypothetical protein